MDDIIPLDIPRIQCTLCKNWKPATFDFFGRSNHVADGFKHQCKVCRKEGRKAPIDDIPEGHKRCYECKEVHPATADFFYVRKSGALAIPCIQCCANKRKSRVELQRMYSHRHYEQHKEEKKQDWIARYEANGEAYRQSRKRFRQEHPDLFRQRYQATRDDYITYNRNRKARKKAAPGRHTAQQIREQYARQKGKCYYCQHKVAWGKHHVDHVIPLSRGGSNDISNLVIACPTCNLRKQDRLPHEFFEGGRLL